MLPNKKFLFPLSTLKNKIFCVVSQFIKFYFDSWHCSCWKRYEVYCFLFKYFKSFTFTNIVTFLFITNGFFFFLKGFPTNSNKWSTLYFWFYKEILESSLINITLFTYFVFIDIFLFYTSYYTVRFIKPSRNPIYKCARLR